MGADGVFKHKPTPPSFSTSPLEGVQLPRCCAPGRTGSVGMMARRFSQASIQTGPRCR